ncbi:MAG: hypothetical protein Q8736_02420 [Sweet potato little leaf phytoplasma]|nr:hypothetical protein [Sweet potato little leaf phytoplasma]
MDDQDQHLHENLQPNFSYSNNLNESKGDLDTNPPKKEEGGYKGEIVKKNQIQENQNGSGKMIDLCKERIENSCESNRKSRTLIEKERREMMGNLFDELRAFIPDLPSTVKKFLNNFSLLIFE